MKNKVLIEFEQDIAPGLAMTGFQWEMRKSILEPRRFPHVMFKNRRFGKVINVEARNATIRTLMANATEASAIYKQLDTDLAAIIEAKMLPPPAIEMLKKKLIVVQDFVKLMEQQNEGLKTLLCGELIAMFL